MADRPDPWFKSQQTVGRAGEPGPYNGQGSCRKGDSVRIGADDLSPRTGAQGPPRGQRDGRLDEPHRAVAEAHVDTTRVEASRGNVGRGDRRVAAVPDRRVRD